MTPGYFSYLLTRLLYFSPSLSHTYSPLYIVKPKSPFYSCDRSFTFLSGLIQYDLYRSISRAAYQIYCTSLGRISDAYCTGMSTVRLSIGSFPQITYFGRLFSHAPPVDQSLIRWLYPVYKHLVDTPHTSESKWFDLLVLAAVTCDPGCYPLVLRLTVL